MIHLEVPGNGVTTPAVGNGVTKNDRDVTQNGHDVTQNGRDVTQNVRDATKNDCDDTHNNSHASAGSSNSDLPAGVSELVDECFVPGAKGYFERRSNLPILQSTRVAARKTNRNKRTGNGGDFQAGKGNGQRRNSLDSTHVDQHMLQLVQASWEVILSFMGDESESLERGQSTRLFEATISERRQHFSSKKRAWRKPADALIHRKTRTVDNQRPTSLYVTSQPNDDKTSDVTQLMTLTRNTIANLTVLEKIRFLVSIGLETPQLKDEIYCQIIKQLVCNPSARSSALGWILFSLVAGCFAPSKRIYHFVENFLRNQTSPWAEYCLEKIENLSKGNRNTPPCSLEVQAAKSRQRIRLPVICMDHSVRTIWTDSSTTAQEICHAMAAKNRLGDSFGFSLFLALDNKLVTLGNGAFFVMDAISQAEEFSKQNEVEEIWRLYYRREFFSPLDACGCQDNQMKAWLTYSQICGGIKSEEYTCKSAQDLALLMAHQYCVRHGSLNVDSRKVFAVCEQNLPPNVFKEDRKRWCQMVDATLQALAKKSTTEKVGKMDILQQVIQFACRTFIKNFTKQFLLASFEPIQDDVESQSSASKLWLKINHERLVVMHDEYVINREKLTSHTEQVKMREIVVANLRSAQLLKPTGKSPCDVRLKLVTRGDSTYYLTSGQIFEIYEIVERFMEEVRSQTCNESEA